MVPSSIPLSSEHISDGGIYFLENGDDALICVGASVDSGILHQLFGASTVEEIPSQAILSYSRQTFSCSWNPYFSPQIPA